MSGTFSGPIINGRQQFIDGNGDPLAGGRVFSYMVGTLIPVNTYQDLDLTILNTNPVVLDAAGMASIFTSEERVRQIVKDRFGNTIWDQVTSSGAGDGGGGSGASIGTLGLVLSNEVAPLNLHVLPGCRFRMPYAMTLSSLRASLFVASSSGPVEVDILLNGVSILSTKLTIDVNETTSVTAAIPPVLTTVSLPADARVEAVVTQTGFGAVGLKLWLLGVWANAPTGPADVSGNNVVAAGGLTPRTLSNHLRRADPRNWGGAGNGVVNDTVALQAAANFAAANGLVWFVPEGTWRATSTITVPTAVAGIEMDGTLLYGGDGAEPALVIGDGGSVNTQAKRFLGLRVQRATLSSWTDENDIGIQLRNIDACFAEFRLVEGFTIGVQLLGVDRGCEDSDLLYGRIVNNRYGLDLRTATSTAWMNGLRHYGGHFANASGTHPTLSRFGVRFSAAPGAYVLHNAHVFVGQDFELQRQGTPGTVDAIPFLMTVDGRGIRAIGTRMEACSPFVARHTSAMNDCTYEVDFVGTFGFTGCAVDYTGATRAGGTVIARHQAAAVQGSPRLVAATPNIRSSAFRNVSQVANGIGFEGLAVLSGNPAGPPTTLNGFAFGGLDSITLNADDVTLPTSRALAFVVDCSLTKEFVLAVDGTELRPVVLQFDASENVLNNTAPVLFSNMNTVWPGTAASWWEGAADLDGLTGGLPLNRHQRVTLHPSAAFAAIGVRGSSASARLKAMRLFCDALGSPSVLFGGSRAWGSRELVGSAVYDPPNLAPGSDIPRVDRPTVAVPGLAGGDQVTVSFTTPSAFIQWSAMITTTGGSGTVTVNARNIHESVSIDLASGTLFVRAVRPRA